jgi:radical SAM protein with 4Fe4S-binding SPASM domain
MANIYDDPRKDLLMPDSLLYKIIDELEEWNYSNRISFYNNNEPFLDKRLPKIIKNARSKIPRSYLEVKSNGRGLKIDKILEVFNAGLDMLYINDYTDTGKNSKNIIKIIDELSTIRRFKGHMESHNGNYFHKIIITQRDVNQVLNTRAGTAPNRNKLPRSLQIPCFRPFEMMTINPEGYVGVCSEDLLYLSKMGDVNKNKLLEIWYSDKYERFRRKLIQGDRGHHKACSNCDYKGFSFEIFCESGILNN